MLCIPTPNHRALVTGCYPPPKKLAGVEKPNSNELGKLVYYAQSKPAKLSKVGKVLEERAASDARNVPSGGEKSRCGLLITLAILKNLVTDCRRDITYISKSAQIVLQHAVTASAKAGAGGRRDLELSARASSTFFAFASAIDPSRSSVEGDLGNSYLALLRGFSEMAMETMQDQEDQNRFRLIGLGALSGAVGSDALYTPSFAQQIEAIVPPLLGNIQASILPLEALETEAQKTISGTPSFSEFASATRKRPGHRRAPSLSGHIAGEKGPDRIQVVSASMGILQSLFRHADATQVQEAMRPVFKWMDGRGGSPQWGQEDWACFLAKTLSRSTALQYRFVVLTSFIEYLVEHCEGPPQTKHATLLAMITETLRAKDLTLIGLSTSDAMNNLAGLLVRRVHFDLKDPLLPQIVEAIESLASHVYYAEQLNDMAEELVARIVALTQPETDVGEATRTSHLGRRASVTAKSGEEQRMESIRTLLFALTRTIVVANTAGASDGEVRQAMEEDLEKPAPKGKDAAKTQAQAKLGITTAGTRSRIQPNVLTPTAALLACSDAPVRLAEAQLLLTYLQLEATEQQDASSSEIASLAHGVAAAAHVAALSSSLRLSSSAASALQTGNPMEALVALDRGDARAKASTAAHSAVPLDYSSLAEVFTHLVAPRGGGTAAGLLAIVPALFSLDRSAATKLVPDAASPAIVAQRRRACRLVLAKVWSTIGQEWNISPASKEAKAVLSALPSNQLPPVPAPHPSLNLAAETELFPESGANGEGSGAASECFGKSGLVKAISASQEVQDSTGLSAAAIERWLLRDWSVSIAVDDANVGATPYAADHHGEGDGDGLGGASGVSRIQIRSAASGAGAGGAGAGAGAASTRSGVEDLRQALGSRTYGGSASVKRAISPTAAAGVGKGMPAPALPGLNGGDNGASAPPNGPTSAAERRASKRASRIHSSSAGGVGASPSKGKGAGATPGVGGLLDSLGIASTVEEQEQHKPALVAPHAA